MLRTKFSPNRWNPALNLSLKREHNISATIPLLRARRITAADEVDIYDFHPDRKYKLSMSGEWIDGSSETFYVSRQYNQKDGMYAYQGTSDNQPELTWVEKDSLSLGSNLITNGDFTNWTGDNPDNWPLGFTENATNYVTEDSGKARIVCDYTGTAPYIFQVITNVVNKIYRVDCDIVVNTLGWRFSVFYGTPSPIPYQNFSTSGHYTFYFKANATRHGVGFFRHTAGASDFTVDNVTVKEVTAFRPTIKFDGTNDYLTVGNVGNIKSVFAVVRPMTPTQPLMDLNGTNTIDISSGTLRANNMTNAELFVNGVSGSSVSASVKSSIALNFDTVAASAAVIGKISSSSFKGDMPGLTVFNKRLSLNEIKRLHAYELL